MHSTCAEQEKKRQLKSMKYLFEKSCNKPVFIVLGTKSLPSWPAELLGNQNKNPCFGRHRDIMSMTDFCCYSSVFFSDG